MKLVIIESPFAGDVETNIAYAKAAVRDCLGRNEAPYASHLFFTQDGLLDDSVPEQRKLGIEAGLAWGEAAKLTALYIDRGLSSGMKYGIERAAKAGRFIEIRTLQGWRLPNLDLVQLVMDINRTLTDVGGSRARSHSG